MTDIPILKGVSAIADRYDVFVLDLWGVLHDGVTAYPGARQTLESLKAAGKRTVLLSNAPRRAFALIEMMEALGLPRTCYDEIISSGEVVWRNLRDRTAPGYRDLGSKLYFIGVDADRHVYEGMDYEAVANPADADFVLVCGPHSFTDAIEIYQPLLAKFAGHLPPLICANPDRAVIRDGKVVVCAGNIADLYADLGGTVIQTGKPDAAIYDDALALLGSPDKSRVLGVGDAFPTDVTGCTAAGIDELLICGGIHAAEMGLAWGDAPTPEALANVQARYAPLRPVAAVPAFVW